ncbi:hypothetical protein BDV96DRAFT_685255 [Lophiotrema nucula]|uniref:Uncharacterized protein n=1 Tax=Lophiotrema nucula TaxID=690887 RepID=A0A6A5ZEA6_9PLEO|nr:hypothetical protein BDV96DRAFT_685255 [Lophiotrema nucula]
MSKEATIALTFGVLTLIMTIAGFHYRDSICCYCLGVLRLNGRLRHRIQDHESENNDEIELQPRRLSVPLYLDSTLLNESFELDEQSD